MNRIIKAFAVFLIILSSNTGLSFAQQLSPEASKLKTVYVQLKIYPGSKPKQLAFIKAFPENRQQFTDIFQPAGAGQLHSDSYSYVSTFINAATDHPAEVIDKLVTICKDMTDKPETMKQLQLALVQLGDQHTKVFAAKVKTLSARDSDNLAKFMADMDGIKDFTPYQELINALDKTDDASFANKLLDARVKREAVH